MTSPLVLGKIAAIERAVARAREEHATAAFAKTHQRIAEIVANA